MTGRVAELNSRLGNLVSVPNNASAKSGASDSFQKVMDQTGSRNGASETGGKQKTDIAQKAPAGKPAADAGRIRDVSSKNDIAGRPEDFEEEVERASETAVTVIAGILNVPVEDVEAAMEQLGFTAEDLLNTDNLAPLVAELTGDGDVSMFLLDSNAYGQLKEVTGAVEELNAGIMEQFSMTPEEFKEAIREAGAAKEDVPLPELAVGEPLTEEQEESGPAVIVKDLTNEKQTAEEPVVDRDADVSRSVEETVRQSGQSASGREEQAEDHERGFQGNADAQLFDQAFNPLKAQVSVEEPYHSSHVDTEDIMRQITEQIKLTLKPESTIMEMELNPASLGRVTVHLEAKNGMVTAQFAAQNAAVKEAIESQAVQLRETLEEQGVKVDAVEVTIASHEFERNLQQEPGGKGGEKEKKAGSVSRRKINLNLMEEEEEELSEEEELAKDIMIQNGNSVDYTA